MATVMLSGHTNNADGNRSKKTYPMDKIKHFDQWYLKHNQKSKILKLS